MIADFTLTITHNVIISDRSESGMVAVASILETCPAAEEYIAAWRISTDRFFLLIAEHERNRIVTVTARNVDDLLSEVLQKLFLANLRPPARAEVDVFCQEPDDQMIHDRIDKLLIAVALDAGSPGVGPTLNSEPRASKRERQEATPSDLSRAGREEAIRYLCRMWIEMGREQPLSIHQTGFPAFENWLKSNGFYHYLVTGTGRYPDREAEGWFSDELTRARRAKG